MYLHYHVRVRIFDITTKLFVSNILGNLLRLISKVVFPEGNAIYFGEIYAHCGSFNFILG